MVTILVSGRVKFEAAIGRVVWKFLWTIIWERREEVAVQVQEK